jgi:hypothetical protein
MEESRPDKPTGDQVDLREQLYNAREVGPIDRVQLPLENITEIHAIGFDLDLELYRPDSLIGPALGSPAEFAEQSLVPMLARHPALRGAEVRDTGRNLHAIIWFDQPVVFQYDGIRRRWAGYVKVIQAALPIDPDMPGITALTRPVGSINGKTGRPVATLRAGTPVPVADVLALYDQMVRAPFRTVMGIIFGAERVSPCPVCGVAGSSLSALDREGRCYGNCGKVKIDRLYDTILAPRAIAAKEGGHAVG